MYTRPIVAAAAEIACCRDGCGLQGFLLGGFVAGVVVGENEDLVAGKGRVFGGGGVAKGVAVGLGGGIAFLDHGTVGALEAHVDVVDGEVVGGLPDDGVADRATVGGAVDVLDVGGGEVVGDGDDGGGLGVGIDAGRASKSVGQSWSPTP